VETIGKIRRRRLVQGDSISAIARDLGLARNTVKRALRFEGEAYEYRRKRQPVPKLGLYLATLDGWLGLEEKLPARERRTAQRMFEALRLEGYTGAVDAVRRHMREWERRRHPIATAFIPQSFAPGEAYQFDWSHEHVELGGLDQVVKVAHVRLCHSRTFFLVAYPRESQEMVFDAHARAFAFLGGVPRRGIYDNLKPAVDAIFVGRERRYNRRFLVMCNHYLIEPTACTPAAGWEKGQVENQVGNVREWLFTPKLRCTDLAELNAHLAARCMQLARERSHPEQLERKVVESGTRNARHCGRCRRPLTALPSGPAASRPPAWCTSSATATASSVATSDRSQPCAPTPSGSSWSVPGRSSVNTLDALNGAARSTTPGTTWRRWSASPAHCATVRRSRTGICRHR
jgi:transposase